MNPKLKTWLIVLSIPVAYALILRLVFDIDILHSFATVMSLSFFMGVPFGVGYLTILLSEKEKTKKLLFRVFAPWMPIHRYPRGRRYHLEQCGTRPGHQPATGPWHTYQLAGISPAYPRRIGLCRRRRQPTLIRSRPRPWISMLSSAETISKCWMALTGCNVG